MYKSSVILINPFPDKKYDVIYADPPWEYRQIGNKKKRLGVAVKHYPTMSTEDICNLPIQNIKTDKTILLIWATFPNIEQTLTVIKKWGFIYKTAGFVWIKKNKKKGNLFWGMGAYTRTNAEVCLLATSKNTKAKQCIKSHAVHQVIESSIEAHSKKPMIVKEKIVQLVGDVPRIELFAREKTIGWDHWGNNV